MAQTALGPKDVAKKVTPEEIAAKKAKIVEAGKKVIDGKTEFLLQNSFVGSCLAKFEVCYKEGIDTMAVNIKGGRIFLYHGIDFVLKLKPKHLLNVLKHELEHILLEHIPRSRNKEPKRSNIAQDMVINYRIFKDDKDALPGNLYVAPKPWKDWTSEQIYDMLQSQDDENLPGGEGLDDHECWGDSDPDELQHSVVKDMVEEAIAKQHGKVPGEYQWMVDAILKHKCDWRRILRHFFNSRIKINKSRTMRVPNRKRGQTGSTKVYMPGHLKTNGIDVIVAIDTSGSMGMKEFKSFMAEMEGIIKQTEATVRLIQIDTRVVDDQAYRRGAWKNIQMKGGGGTDFNHFFEYIDNKKYKPNAIVFFTDGYASYPAQKPAGCPDVMWIQTAKQRMSWGINIDLELD